MIATDVERVQQVLTEALMDEFEAQGHSMTGKLIKDIEYQVKQETDKLTIAGFMYGYGNILAAGTSLKDTVFRTYRQWGDVSLYSGPTELC